jgi:hypothetical protein
MFPVFRAVLHQSQGRSYYQSHFLKADRLSDGGSRVKYCEVCDKANQWPTGDTRYFRRTLLVADYLSLSYGEGISAYSDLQCWNIISYYLNGTVVLLLWFCNFTHWANFFLIRFVCAMCKQTAGDSLMRFSISASILNRQCRNIDKDSFACHLISRRFLARLILRPWRWRRYVPPKRRLTFSGLHGVISQKIVLFKVIFSFE